VALRNVPPAVWGVLIKTGTPLVHNKCKLCFFGKKIQNPTLKIQSHFWILCFDFWVSGLSGLGRCNFDIHDRQSSLALHLILKRGKTPKREVLFHVAMRIGIDAISEVLNMHDFLENSAFALEQFGNRIQSAFSTLWRGLQACAERFAAGARNFSLQIKNCLAQFFSSLFHLGIALAKLGLFYLPGGSGFPPPAF
jgi:hypothetical protein